MMSSGSRRGVQREDVVRRLGPVIIVIEVPGRLLMKLEHTLVHHLLVSEQPRCCVGWNIAIDMHICHVVRDRVSSAFVPLVDSASGLPNVVIYDVAHLSWEFRKERRH